MKPDYKNWIPKGMIWSFAAGTAVCLAVALLVGINWLKISFFIITIVLALVTLWTVLMYRAFSYDGKRQMSRQIIEGVAGYVHLPEGGRGLDVGCGSGALTIAVASTAGARITPPSASRCARTTPVRRAFPGESNSPGEMR